VEVLLVNAKVQKPEESPAKIANIQQIIMVINALSKGFSERLVTASRPAIGLMFKQTLDVLLQILIVFPKIEPLRCKVTSFIHRMVDTLGASVFPYLPKALGQLLAESEPKELVGFLVLINQLICKFNTAVHDILEELYPVLASRIFNILPRDAFPSGPGSNTEEIRELQELQRTLYTFLHVITTHDLSSVFLSPKSRGYLDPMMQLLLFTSCNHKDILIRKVPGFQSFVIEAFATNCCLYSVLDKSFELRDANTCEFYSESQVESRARALASLCFIGDVEMVALDAPMSVVDARVSASYFLKLILFGEIVLAQKVMYEKFGNDFLIHFVSKGFPTAHCPQDMAEQYCQKLQGNDVKALKSFYQALIESLRQQQNGSLGTYSVNSIRLAIPRTMRCKFPEAAFLLSGGILVLSIKIRVSARAVTNVNMLVVSCSIISTV
ncbi:hypothetical protein RJ639_016900, partial [Escallonia herrerae]